MIHPDTELKHVDEKKGRGIFATNTIPKGTITYVKDPLEIEIKPGDPRLNKPDIKDLIETYSYIDENGTRILSWDNAKYVNHCCRCNTMSTGYGFEIAIKDIETGEEITDEYGMFNFEYTLELNCNKSDCRKKVSGCDLESKHEEWDSMIRPALALIPKVNQPLLNFLESETRNQLQKYLATGEGYRSVLCLRYKRG